MKVNGIELLQMIKDGKIKEDTKIKSYIGNAELESMYLDDNKNLKYKNGGNTCVPTHTLLGRYFEVIEEDKPIEKIRQFCEYPCSDGYECWSIKEDILVNKINEIIDRLNNLEKKEGK